MMVPSKAIIEVPPVLVVRVGLRCFGKIPLECGSQVVCIAEEEVACHVDLSEGRQKPKSHSKPSPPIGGLKKVALLLLGRFVYLMVVSDLVHLSVLAVIEIMPSKERDD